MSRAVGGPAVHGWCIGGGISLISACEKVARESVLKSGGKIERSSNGAEVFILPLQQATPSKLEQAWQPGPVSNSKFTPEEMAKIKPPAEKK